VAEAEAPLADLPKVLSRPPWISGKQSRVIHPIRVATKDRSDMPATKLAEQVARVKEGKVEEAADSPAIALAMLDATNVFGGWRSDLDACVWHYFETHVETTALALVPIAVGEAGMRRKIAERALRKLAGRHGDTVRAVASGYGKKVLASVIEILAFDMRFDCPNVAPQLPAAWRPAAFTRPLLRDGRALPLVAVDRIGHMLAFSTLDRRYEGLSDVKSACESRSVAELAWDMARAWEAAGGDKRDQWMLESIAHLGDDEVIRRTTPALTHPSIVPVLGHTATAAAATELCTLAWRATHEASTRPAQMLATVAAAFATIARKQGITVEQVEDSLLPTIPIAASNDSDVPVSSRLVSMRSKSIDARVKLDYGSRTIAVGFDERLDPFVESANGSKLRDLPGAGTKDDPKKVARAEEVWRELQEDVAAIADVRLASLERAMLSGRSWTLEAFRHAWMDHPLMRHLSRSVVWRSGETAFRIGQDGTFADVNDAELRVLADVSAAHPAEMTADECAHWGDVLTDYRIIQPIEQLSRRVLRSASATLVPAVPTSQSEFYQRLAGKRFEVGARGRDPMVSRACLRGSGRLRVTLTIDKQMVASLALVAERGGKVVPLESVHAVDLGELAHDLDVVPA
jgi:hypothetical protein